MKTLLVPFYDDDAAQTALDTALTIGAASDGYVEGLFVMRPPQIIDGEGIALAGSYLNQLKEEGRRLADRAAERFHGALESRGLAVSDVNVDSTALSAGWREMDGLEGQVVGDYGRIFDLVVIGRGFGQPWLDWNVMCESALFETGRPVLVTASKVPERIGSKVLIAWNGSTETARTIAFGMPFLGDAESVEVLSVSGWAVPGLGHFLIGRRRKAALYFVTIAATFVLGVLLAQGRNLSYERDAVYFLAYMWNGAMTGIGWLLTRGLEYDHPIPLLQVGFLYTAVACLLNLVVMVDFVNACSRRPEAAKA